jgi:hypothetical protein
VIAGLKSLSVVGVKPPKILIDVQLLTRNGVVGGTEETPAIPRVAAVAQPQRSNLPQKHPENQSPKIPPLIWVVAVIRRLI